DLRAIFIEGIRPGIAADHRGVADEAALLPEMQLIARRLQDEDRRAVGAQIERHLMRGAGCRAGDGAAADRRLDRAVQMPAQDTLDLRMAREDLGEALGAVQS